MEKNKILYFIKRPQYLFLSLGHRGFLNWMKDETYLKIAYWCKMGKKLNLQNPVTFNEKLQWLKLNNQNPEYTNVVDKYEVRNYIEKKIGKEYLNPLFGVWDNIDNINFDKLPNQFVLKCTHDSGGLVICKDKTELDICKTKKKIKKSLKYNYYWGQREWIYKNIKPKIICEKFLVQNDGDELRDYRFFCFNGEPKFITVDFSIIDKKKTRRNLYDLHWNLMDAEISYPKETNIRVDKPKKLEEMIELSKKLSTGFPHTRVDFYYIDNRIIFGEITFFHQSGMGKISPEEFDKTIGGWLEIPKYEEVIIK